MARPRNEVGRPWLALLLALWGASALTVAVWQAATTRPDPEPRLYPSRWRLGAPAVEPLREYLGRVERLLPEGATVVVDSHVIQGSEQILLLAWCRYLLPRQHVQLGGTERGVAPRYRLVVPAVPADVATPPGQTVLLHEAPATLLRVEPRSTQGGEPAARGPASGDRQ